VKRRILIVDDNREVCRVVADMLSGVETEIREVYNGADAIGVLDKQESDVAIVDLLLSGPVSSDAVIAHAKYRRCLVITISGTLSSDLRGRELDTPHLVKPFATQQLIGLVEATLARRGRPAAVL
jgi:DNA-binding NtrC family response regulator